MTIILTDDTRHVVRPGFGIHCSNGLMYWMDEAGKTMVRNVSELKDVEP